MEAKYICIDGEFLKADESQLLYTNRAFQYGDALFETIHCSGTSPHFIGNHITRLKQGMKVLHMDYTEDLEKDKLCRNIEKLLNKNRIFKGARIRLTIFRKAGGLYTPTTHEVSWLMQCSVLENEFYELNQAGLHVDIFDEVHKPVNILSNLKTNNALIYVLAGNYRNQLQLDECIVLNQFGRVCETISSNIFIYHNEKLITPPLSEGCIAGTMRFTVLQLAELAGYRTEERGILEKHLIEAEEVFITNAIQGIRWVSAYKDRRYFNFVSRKLMAALKSTAQQS